MSDQSRAVSGAVPVDLPIQVEGPDPKTWQDLAKQTLKLANHVDDLDQLLDFSNYDASTFQSIGDYLRKIAFDFNATKLALKRATSKTIKLTIVWASESSGHGVLSSLTSSSRFELLDASALLDATSKSVVARWWAKHRGLLVQTIVRLDAHAVCLPPSVAIAIFRRYGSSEFVQALKDMNINSRSPAEVNDYLARSDLGRHLLGEPRSVSEARGNPAEDARAASQLIGSQIGFTAARDKALNLSCAEALSSFLNLQRDREVLVGSEKKRSFVNGLIPDNSIEYPSSSHCIEYTWRQGDFLLPKNRATVAEYVLRKLQNYARELGWISD